MRRMFSTPKTGWSGSRISARICSAISRDSTSSTRLRLVLGAGTPDRVAQIVDLHPARPRHALRLVEAEQLVLRAAVEVVGDGALRSLGRHLAARLAERDVLQRVDHVEGALLVRVTRDDVAVAG